VAFEPYSMSREAAVATGFSGVFGFSGAAVDSSRDVAFSVGTAGTRVSKPCCPSVLDEAGAADSEDDSIERKESGSVAVEGGSSVNLDVNSAESVTGASTLSVAASGVVVLAEVDIRNSKDEAATLSAIGASFDGAAEVAASDGIGASESDVLERKPNADSPSEGWSGTESVAGWFRKLNELSPETIRVEGLSRSCHHRPVA